MALLGQAISLAGVLLAMGGVALAFVYDRPLTWARAAVGAWLFVGTMLIVFGVIPNQWLTLAQSTLEWTPQKVFLTVPSALVLGNELSISYAVLKDIISGTYAVVMLLVVAVAMVRWQERAKRGAEAAPPTPISAYGRPMRVEG